MNELVLLAGAEADMIELYVRYDALSPSYAERYYAALGQALDLLERFPEIGPRYHSHYRRLVIQRFSLGVFYSIEGRRIAVGAILDLRQSPEAIMRRLGK